MNSFQKKNCNVCIEEFNTNDIKSCPYCEYEVCINCIKKYSIESIKHTDKKCMSCKKKFTRHTLVKLFGKTYVNGLYKDHIKELLFNEEKTLIPRSLPVVENNKKLRLQRQEIEKLEEELNVKINNEIIKRNTIEHYIECGMINSCRQYNTYQNTIEFKNKNKKEIITKKYKHPCANNNCNGFVNDKWYCELCDNYTCKECLIIIENKHICNDDDIKTAKLIKSQCKPCPTCNISIIKSSGCDQMWCVSCHTTFDWKTLEIKKSGIVHNPEYFRYMRENGLIIARNPNDNECNNDDEFHEAFHKLSKLNSEFKKDLEHIKICNNVTHESLKKDYIIYNLKNRPQTISEKVYFKSEEYANKKFDEYKKYLNTNTISKLYDKDIFNNLFSFIREINHMEDYGLREYRRKIYNYDSYKDSLRIKYLEKIINETKYKTDLARKHKEIEFLNELISHHETIVEVCKSFTVNYINTLYSEYDITNMNKQKKTLFQHDLYIKLFEFVEDIIKVTNETRDIYGYKTKNDWIPDLLRKQVTMI